MSNNNRPFLAEMFLKFPWRDVIAIFALGCIFAYLFVDRTYANTAREGSDVKIALLTLGTVILSYYFGASKGKTDTDERKAVEELIQKTPEPARTEMVSNDAAKKEGEN